MGGRRSPWWRSAKGAIWLLFTTTPCLGWVVRPPGGDLHALGAFQLARTGRLAPLSAGGPNERSGDRIPDLAATPPAAEKGGRKAAVSAVDPLGVLKKLRERIGLTPSHDTQSDEMLVQDVNDRNAQAEARLDSVVSALTDLKAQQVSYMEEREEEMGQVDAYTSLFKKLKAKLTTVEKELDKIRRELTGVQSQRRELEARLEDVTGEGKAVKPWVVNDLRKKLETETRRGQTLEERKAVLEEDRAEAQQQMDEILRTMTALYEQERKAFVSQLNSLTKSLGVQSEAARAAKQAAGKVKDTYEKDIQGLQILLEKQRTRYANTFMEMEERIKQLEVDLRDYNRLREQDGERQELLSELERVLAETQSALAILTAQEEEVRGRLQVETERRKKAEAQLSTFKSMYEEETSRLGASLAKVLSRLDASEEGRREAVEEVQDLQAKSEAAREQLESLTSQYESTIAEKSEALSVLEGSLTRIREQLVESQQKRQEAEQAVKELQRKREEDQRTVTDLRERYETVAGEKATDLATIAKLSNSLAAARADVKSQAKEHEARMQRAVMSHEQELEIYVAQARGYEMKAQAESANAKRERERLKRSVRVFSIELARLHSERQSIRKLIYRLLVTIVMKLLGREDKEAKEVMDRARRITVEASVPTD